MLEDPALPHILIAQRIFKGYGARFFLSGESTLNQLQETTQDKSNCQLRLQSNNLEREANKQPQVIHKHV